ncbi:hypothetical protein GCM10009680_21410 [Streptomyces yatensis]|uniref:Uncharacterized protein n=1 Tax=Streptomyces yatensis TaxID=155177 RepID=A0ABN2H5N1_9ACTN
MATFRSDTASRPSASASWIAARTIRSRLNGAGTGRFGGSGLSHTNMPLTIHRIGEYTVSSEHGVSKERQP